MQYVVWRGDGKGYMMECIAIVDSKEAVKEITFDDNGPYFSSPLSPLLPPTTTNPIYRVGWKTTSDGGIIPPGWSKTQ